MRRPLSIGLGVLLIAGAFLAGGRVADTREGLFAEVATLLCGLAGASLLLFGLVPRWAGAPSARTATTARRRPATQVRSADDLLLGVSGLALGAILIGGLAIGGAGVWALLAAVLLLPLLIGSTYLVGAFMAAPKRVWKIDVRRLTGRRRAGDEG